MNLNNAKTLLIEKGYQIGPRFKLKPTDKYWMYAIDHPDGKHETLTARKVEMLARKVARGA